VKSRNAYARYEQGVSVPAVEKLDELVRAVAPARELVAASGLRALCASPDVRSRVSRTGDVRQRHQSETPMTNTWRLAVPLPGDLFATSAVA